MFIAKTEFLEDLAAQIEKLKKLREKRKALETVQKRDLILQQIKKATKRLISNETSQEISLRLNDFANPANRSAVKISNETLQESSIR
jgi:hypothetical protein